MVSYTDGSRVGGGDLQREREPGTRSSDKEGCKMMGRGQETAGEVKAYGRGGGRRSTEEKKKKGVGERLGGAGERRGLRVAERRRES